MKGCNILQNSLIKSSFFKQLEVMICNPQQKKGGKHQTLLSSSSFPIYLVHQGFLVSLPDILAWLGAKGSKYIGNWKTRACLNLSGEQQQP